MQIARYARRGCEELLATLQIAQVVGPIDALATLRGKIEIQRMCRDGYQEPPARYKALMRKHEVMLRYYYERYHEYFDSYDFAAPLPERGSEFEGKVWVCWWQGIENAPEIVKACVESIRKAAGKHEVVVLNQENYRSYVDMPDWIIGKFEAGIISRTQFSDCLRFALLAEHGGLWMDATVYCSAPLPDDFFSSELFTVARSECDHMSVAAGGFTDFLLGCNVAGRRIFASIRDAYYLYWQTNDMLIDYLTNDYMIVLLQKLDEGHVGRAFAGIKSSNPHMGDLLIRLNEPYDESWWDSIKTDTFLFKLSWKVATERSSKGRETFYSRIVSGRLS